MKKVFRYIGYIIRDCNRAYPAFLWICILVHGMGMAVSVVGPLLLADILELAAEGQGIYVEKLVKEIVLYGILMISGPVLDLLFYACANMSNVYGRKYCGKQLFSFSKKIRLEALENPEVLDKFNKADVTVQREGAHFSFMDLFLRVIKNIAVCIGIMAVVGRYSPLLIIIGLAGALPIWLTRMYLEKGYTALRRRQSNVRRRGIYFWGLFTRKESIKEMRVMGFGEYLKGKWEETNTNRVRERRGVELENARKSALGAILQNMFYALNIAVSFYLTVQGKISIGAFAACLSAFATYQTGLQLFISDAFQAVNFYHIIEDYYDYFTIPTEVDGEKNYQPFEEKISAEDVHFRYSGSSREALCGLNCSIKKGEHIVIVGENGSGKTTFSKLLTGAYLPSRGSISYDSQRTEDLKRVSLYDHISIVPQDFVHYQFTLRENIGISNLKRMDDTKAMEELLSQVAGEDFLERKGGLDIQLGREFGGQELSGGEWQKIAIARGLWKDGDIIILDEPTSALDPLMEYDILSKFVEMIQDKTSIIISHRVGVCRSADKIIVMKAGQVVECGRHEELLEKKGEYARIWQEQAKWYA